jgi:hypothetical protein
MTSHICSAVIVVVLVHDLADGRRLSSHPWKIDLSADVDARTLLGAEPWAGQSTLDDGVLRHRQPNAGIAETLWGQAPGGCYGYSHALGGWAGSHAEYVHVPHADHGAFAVPDGVSDQRHSSPPMPLRRDGWERTSAESEDAAL